MSLSFEICYSHDHSSRISILWKLFLIYATCYHDMNILSNILQKLHAARECRTLNMLGTSCASLFASVAVKPPAWDVVRLVLRSCHIEIIATHSCLPEQSCSYVLWCDRCWNICADFAANRKPHPKVDSTKAGLANSIYCFLTLLYHCASAGSTRPCYIQPPCD